MHIQSQRVSWIGRGSIGEKFLVRVLKQRESLTFISRLDVVPVDENTNIVDVKIIFEGQRLRMNIPSGSAAVDGFPGACHPEGNELHKMASGPGRGLSGRRWYPIVTVPTPSKLPPAKITGSFLVLVPLVAFCIRCIMAASQKRATKSLRHEGASDARLGRHGSMRWKAVLSDLNDPEALDMASEPDSEVCAEEEEEEEEQLHLDLEDIASGHSHSYNSKLEDEYEKFLSECGMSKWGYWRGGSPPQ
ncbi:uncharacterized protein LOC127246327 isoform X2 [Andrographis paniculata]|uniref:uncharacterized protein LOC127246327 isoform X2 n=1 Tax=Andrographis paniculata TaxID=175694 RepID=UPI0021E872BF|nr:uncharacterized protein LOC127246327 isoform X2 [Andrographis paniculata]